MKMSLHHPGCYPLFYTLTLPVPLLPQSSLSAEISTGRVKPTLGNRAGGGKTLAESHPEEVGPYRAPQKWASLQGIETSQTWLTSPGQLKLMYRNNSLAPHALGQKWDPTTLLLLTCPAKTPVSDPRTRCCILNTTAMGGNALPFLPRAATCWPRVALQKQESCRG